MMNIKMFCLIRNVWGKVKKHRIGTYEINKISFSCFDDKTYILDNGTDVYIKNYSNFWSNQDSFFSSCKFTNVWSNLNIFLKMFTVVN